MSGGISLAVHWLRLSSDAGAQVQSLVGELRSYMLCVKTKPKHKKQKQYCNNSIKTLKMVTSKILKKKKSNFLKDSSLVSACPLVQKMSLTLESSFQGPV